MGVVGLVSSVSGGRKCCCVRGGMSRSRGFVVVLSGRRNVPRQGFLRGSESHYDPGEGCGEHGVVSSSLVNPTYLFASAGIFSLCLYKSITLAARGHQPVRGGIEKVCLFIFYF